MEPTSCRYLHASSMRIAVAVMLPGDLLQHPATPVQNAMKMTKNATIRITITERPMSVEMIREEKIVILIIIIINVGICLLLFFSLVLRF